MKELISIIPQGNRDTVNARELHEFLEVQTRFNDWIRARIEKFSFVEGDDYVALTEKPVSGNNASIREYYLSLDMAKELAMVENNPQGRLARQYFIECERRAKAPKMPQGKELLAVALLEAAETMKAQEQLIAELAPDAQIAQRIANAEGLQTLSELGKIYGLGPRKIFDLLAEKGIIFKRRDTWLPYQGWLDKGYFEVKEGTYSLLEGDHLYSQTYVTGKGVHWLARQFFPVSKKAQA